MAKDSSLALQEAVLVALAADAGVKALLGTPARVFDYVAENTVQPYISLRVTSAAEWDTDTDEGEEHSLTIDVWSENEGSKTVYDIVNAVKDVLNDNTGLSLTDHNLVNLRRQFRDVVREPDGQWYHGIIRYRAVTEETT